MMSISQHIMGLLLPQSKAEAVTNAVAAASIPTAVLPTWLPSEDMLQHHMVIIYIGVSIVWVVVQIGFKLYAHFKERPGDCP